MADTSDLVIRHDTLIHATPAHVYKTLTTAEGWDAWFTSGAKVDARQGGRIEFRWQDWGPDRITDEGGGPVLEAIPGSTLRFPVASRR